MTTEFTIDGLLEDAPMDSLCHGLGVSLRELGVGATNSNMLVVLGASETNFIGNVLRIRSNTPVLTREGTLTCVLLWLKVKTAAVQVDLRELELDHET